MTSPPFLIDSNILIVAKNTTYPFDIFPSFWNNMKSSIEAGNIKIIKAVKDEIKAGRDELSAWLDDVSFSPIVHDSLEVISNYAEITEYIVRQYSEREYRKWIASMNIADPWLIACSMAYGGTIVTQEEHVSQNSQKIKIPNVADCFSVSWTRSIDMMRALKFRI